MQRKTRSTATTAIRALALTAFVTAGVFAAGSPGGSLAMAATPSSDFPLAGGASNPPRFEDVDADDNGLIEPDEVYAVGVPFTMLDRNGDGTVSRVEYMSSIAQYAGNESQAEVGR